ncbi:uncharacterized protein LOC126673228 [Mercurialis annua]|uniref:uncharacterized protein LOC126673228 n=1 Tax=Mercurialis annua TaxID=3986 RepID=UPI00215E6D66|nr:uncharacterized protein LOC126673228 [Mercurialis annua]
MAKINILWFILCILSLQIIDTQVAQANHRDCIADCNQQCENKRKPFLCQLFCPPYCANDLKHAVLSKSLVTQGKHHPPSSPHRRHRSHHRHHHRSRPSHQPNFASSTDSVSSFDSIPNFNPDPNTDININTDADLPLQF